MRIECSQYGHLQTCYRGVHVPPIPKGSNLFFVDDIQALARSAQEAMEATQGMADFCRLLNLPIDAAKSFAWSTSSNGRKHIQEAGIICKLYSRGLGFAPVFGPN